MEFTGEVVLVTGGSRGIGRAVAEQFAQEGARVAVHYNTDRNAARETLAALPGGPHCTVQADLTDPQAAVRLVETTVERMGRLDVLINNAGVYEDHPLASMEFDDWRKAWDRTIAANLTAPAYLSFFAAKQMLRQGGGRIVNISSRGAFRGEPDAPAYGASKAGLNALSQSMAKALAPHKIFVTAVAPGWVETDMAEPYLKGPGGNAIRAQSPLDRAALPGEMARIVVFLASRKSEYLTGCIIDANGASYLRT
jgi:NAD(P)-dependent dehydrogenase (short-subunit alcohol dehydrogenase family)